MIKIDVIIGHNSRATGAYAPAPISQSEFIFNTRVAQYMKQLEDQYGMDLKIINRYSTGSYTREIRNAYAQVRRDAKAAVELHFNSAGPGATGTEMLYARGSKRGYLLARKVQNAALSALGLRDRGVKPRSSGERGGKSLFAASPPTIITEPFFASSDRDLRSASNLGHAGFARMYLEGLKEYVRAT